MAETDLSVEFPKKIQENIWTPSRYKVFYGGRGSGKSWGVARALVIRAATSQVRVLCGREVQSSIKDSVHQLLVDQIIGMGLDHLFDIRETEIRGKNGSLFTFVGLRTQDATKIKSYEGYDICWLEEAQTLSDKSLGILIPTIRKPGSEIWITFNPDLDTDPVYKRFVVNTAPDSRVVFINWRDNPWFPDVLERERLHLLEVDPEAYENIWEGKCKSAVDGAIYAREIEEATRDNRICNVPYDPLLKVHTVWDLGWNDQTSVIFVQKHMSEIRIIDYLEDSHRTLDDYVGEINGKRYNWGSDFIPHDGAAKNLQTGLSPSDILSKLGRAPVVIPASPIESGIKTARLIFRQCYFDETKTQRLVECLKRYRRSIPTTTEEPAKPIHDQYSHGADAFRLLSVCQNKMTNDEWSDIKYDDRGIV